MAHSHDIEDVLSSIRRLVANENDGAPSNPSRSTPPASSARPETPALVLAPTQRVTEVEDPFQMIRSLAQQERDGRDAAFVVKMVDREVTAITDDLVAQELEGRDWPEGDAPEAGTDVPEEYVEDTDYQPEPEADAPSGWPEQADAAVSSELSDDDDGALDDLSEAVGKDEALRGLISEIVRQELSGALGERITRNVRKLVRRELRQMLSSGDFD